MKKPVAVKSEPISDKSPKAAPSPSVPPRCETPHVAAWSADGKWLALVDRGGGLDVHDLERGDIAAQTRADPCVTLRPTKHVSTRNLAALASPTERFFAVHEEGLQHVVPGGWHTKLFFSFPKVAGFVARHPDGRAFFAHAPADSAKGPYSVDTYLSDGKKSDVPAIRIEGEILSLACVDGKPAWIARRDGNVWIGGESKPRVDLSALGELHYASLEPSGAALYVAERRIRKQRGACIVAGVTTPEGSVKHEEQIGGPEDLKVHGGRVEVRALGEDLVVAMFGSAKKAGLLLEVKPAGEVREHDLGPAPFVDLSPDGTLAVVSSEGATSLRSVPSLELRRWLIPAIPDETPREPAPDVTLPTNDPRALLERRLRGARLAPERVEAAMHDLSELDDDAFQRESELVEIALANERTSDEAIHLVVTQLLARLDIDFDLRKMFVTRVASGIEKRPKVTDLIRELRAGSTEAHAAARARLEAPPTMDLTNAHSVLASVLRALASTLTPRRPCHRGEPLPVIGARGWPLLAMFMARRLERLLQKPERAAFDAALEQASRWVFHDPKDAKSKAPDPAKEPPATKKQCSLALLLAETAWKEARQAGGRRPDLVGGSLRPAATKAVKGLLETEGKEAALDLLEAIDDELRRLDVVNAVREKAERDLAQSVDAAVLRGGEKSKVRLWLARLTDGRYGMLWKEGARWTWTEGDRDTVLATVPDAFFEAAAMADNQLRTATSHTRS